MESLMDSLEESMWKAVEASNRGDGYKEYKVMRHHKQVQPGVFKYLIQEEEGDPKGILVEGCRKDHDPLKDIGTCEMKIEDESGKVLGIDLDGDIAIRTG